MALPLDRALAAAGELDGPLSLHVTHHASRQRENESGLIQPNAGGLTSNVPKIPRHHSAKPYQYERVPKRDRRFPDPLTWASTPRFFSTTKIFG